MNEKENSVMNTVPAASMLHQVPCFDPLRLLRKTTSKTGEKILKLDLRYKKMWFRLVHPKGRMITNTLRLTDQMAIFEAQLFADRDSSMALSQFTSCHTKDISGPNYIRAAQDEAMNVALDNAGFGIQLADLLADNSDSGYGSEILLSQVEMLLRQPEHVVPQKQTSSEAPVQNPASSLKKTVQHTAPPNQAVERVSETEPPHLSAAPVCEVPAASAQAKSPNLVQEPSDPIAPSTIEIPVVQTASSETQQTSQAVMSNELIENPVDPAEKPDGKDSNTETSNILQVLAGMQNAAAENVPTQAEAPVAETAVQTHEVEPVADETTEPAVAYTEDMSVEEIRQLITSEQAKALVVTFGPNKGFTLGQVMDRRPSSLRFYALASADASNAMKAASLLLLDELKQMRAG